MEADAHDTTAGATSQPSAAICAHRKRAPLVRRMPAIQVARVHRAHENLLPTMVQDAPSDKHRCDDAVRSVARGTVAFRTGPVGFISPRSRIRAPSGPPEGSSPASANEVHSYLALHREHHQRPASALGRARAGSGFGRHPADSRTLGRNAVAPSPQNAPSGVQIAQGRLTRRGARILPACWCYSPLIPFQVAERPSFSGVFVREVWCVKFDELRQTWTKIWTRIASPRFWRLRSECMTKAPCTSGCRLSKSLANVASPR